MTEDIYEDMLPGDNLEEHEIDEDPEDAWVGLLNEIEINNI